MRVRGRRRTSMIAPNLQSKFQVTMFKDLRERYGQTDAAKDGGGGGGGKEGRRNRRERLKEGRRQQQQRAVNRKSRDETSYFWSCVQNAGRGGARRPPTQGRAADRAEAQLFAAHSGVAGIDFDKYDAIPVDRSGPRTSERDVPALRAFSDLEQQLPKPVKHAKKISKCERARAHAVRHASTAQIAISTII